MLPDGWVPDARCRAGPTSRHGGKRPLRSGTVAPEGRLWRTPGGREAHRRRHLLAHAVRPRRPERPSGRQSIPRAETHVDIAFPGAIRRPRASRNGDQFRSAARGKWSGSDNFNSLVGSPPVGVVFSEWALADPTGMGLPRPILAENGGWALFISTPARPVIRTECMGPRPMMRARRPAHCATGFSGMPCLRPERRG